MGRAVTVPAVVRQICREDSRFAPESYFFVLEGLEHTLQRIGRRRHVRGRELLEGIREYALTQFGFLARSVFLNWGIRRTEDFGEIVFRLVDEGVMGKTEEDSPEDFRGVYDFEEAFGREYSVEGEWKSET